MNSLPLTDGLCDVELQATRLDGETYRLGDTHVAVGIDDSPAARAASVLTGLSPRYIAARRTAAWVWGPLLIRPTPLELVVDLDARCRPAHGSGLDVMESVLRPGDVVALDRARVTSPLRTALDLARFTPPAQDVTELVRDLACLGGFGLDDAQRALDRGRNLAGKVLAVRRLRAALSPS